MNDLMGVAVTRYFVSPIRSFSQYTRKALCNPAKSEKGRSHVTGGEEIENHAKVLFSRVGRQFHDETSGVPFVSSM